MVKWESFEIGRKVKGILGIQTGQRTTVLYAMFVNLLLAKRKSTGPVA